MHFNRTKISSKKRLQISPNIKKGRKKIKMLGEGDIELIPRVRKRNRKVSNVAQNKITITKKEKAIRYKFLREWKYYLSGHPAFILGNAPSISAHNLDILKPYFTIGINRIFYIYDPTILLWQDKEVWVKDKKGVLKQRAIKVCRDEIDSKGLFANFSLSKGRFKFGSDPSRLHGRGNTGALAAQLAVAIGCSSIVLIGMDCKYSKGKTDFYGKNTDHKPYTLRMCNRAMKWIRDKSPVPVYNCSDNGLWEKRSLEDVVEEIRPPRLNRDYFLQLFGGR